MAANSKPDFSGWVTRYGLKCTDGRTILPDAFKHNNGAQIPMVWQHQHNSIDNILGHMVLEHKDGQGVWVDGYFNATAQGQSAKEAVIHKDIKHLSIYANGLVQQGPNVTHGNIREGSLVMAGANPGALIDPLSILHGDGSESLVDDQVIIYLSDDDVIEHATSTAVAQPGRVVVPAKPPLPAASDTSDSASADDEVNDDDVDFDEATIQDVIDSMNPLQQKVAFSLVGAALQQGDTSGDDPDSSITHTQEGDNSVANVFDQSAVTGNATKLGATLSHSDMREIFDSAHKLGSLKAAVEGYALAHNIDDISTLFPYDQAVTDTPEFISRRMEWVQGVLSKVRKTPFSRIRSWTADITLQEARAKGYVKGSLKKEEFFRIARRITTPQTVYKKQKLDRDDILDITEFAVVDWLQTEMRVMLDEELARAILIGDGREVDDPDKISTSNVRPIFGDDEMYVTPIYVSATSIATTADAIVDGVVKGFRFYRGSGNPCMYTTRIWLAKMLLIKDTLGRRLYPTVMELASALGVDDIIPCEALEVEADLIGIIVNLQDYTCGTDRGGEVSMFDFFDIDYNQFKYLMETRMSGAMTKYRGALTVHNFTGTGLLPDPDAPTFDDVTGIGTIPAFSGLHYTYVTVADDGTLSSALTVGAQSAVAANAYVVYRAVPDSGYEFTTDNFEWTFRRN